MSESSKSIMAPTSVRGERKNQKREAILYAAIEIFAYIGFDAASIGNIAVKAGVKKALVQYHFETKENLWKQAVRLVWQRRAEAIPHLLNNLDNLDKEQLIRELFRRIMHFAADNPAWVGIMFKEAAQPSERLDWLIDELIRDDFKNGLEFVEVAQHKGLLPELQPLHLLHILSGALTYVLNVAPLSQRVLGIDAKSDVYIEEHIDALMAMLNYSKNSA